MVGFGSIEKQGMLYHVQATVVNACYERAQKKQWPKVTHPRWVTLCHLKQVTHLAGFRTAAVGHFRVGHLWVTCLAILSGSLASRLKPLSL